MDLRFFFEGMLDHEVSTSAFFAMLLEGCVPFRDQFLKAVLPEGVVPDIARCTVAVEAEQVDVTVDCGPWTILVENKIQGGSVEPGQLRRYYLSAREKTRSDRRIAAVWLAPKGVGAGQVTLVRSVLVGGDHASHLSWEDDVSSWIAELPDGPERDLARSGVGEVLRIIAERRRGLVKSDERLEIRRIAAMALGEILQTRPGAIFLTWSGSGYEQIFTPRSSPFAVYLTLGFDESGPPEHEPRTRLSDGRRRVTLRLQMRKGATIRGDSREGMQWASRSDEFAVADVGVLARASKAGWFDWTEPVTATSEEIAARLAQLGVRALEAIDAFLGAA